MRGGMSAVVALVGGALALLLVGVVPAAAQGLIEWRPRMQLRPDALAAGAAAAFWNPAAARPTGRAELLAADLHVPTGLRGIAAAGALALAGRAALALGYQNLRIEEMDRTSTSPLPDPGGAGLDVSEHVFSAAFAYAPVTSLSAGVAVRYVRHAAVLGGGDAAAVAGGAVWRADGRLAPRLGGMLVADPERVYWALGAELAPVVGPAGTRAVLGYGVDTTPAAGVAQRLATGVVWRGFASLTAALLGEPETTGTSWHPAVEAGVQVRRYGLGFAHERLPNGFGGVNTFRLSVVF